jgi:hypothetical protein
VLYDLVELPFCPEALFLFREHVVRVLMHNATLSNTTRATHFATSTELLLSATDDATAI